MSWLVRPWRLPGAALQLLYLRLYLSPPPRHPQPFPHRQASLVGLLSGADTASPLLLPLLHCSSLLLRMTVQEMWHVTGQKTDNMSNMSEEKVDKTCQKRERGTACFRHRPCKLSHNCHIPTATCTMRKETRNLHVYHLERQQRATNTPSGAPASRHSSVPQAGLPLVSPQTRQQA